jgi:hypothetical protein
MKKIPLPNTFKKVAGFYVSAELKRQIDIERMFIRKLFESHAGLLHKGDAYEPNLDELAAMGAILHGFYNGVENIFKRIAETLDGGLPRGPSSHAELIGKMSIVQPHRPAVLSESLSLRLEEYLDFRHVFRHAYSFDFRWAKMKHLVLGAEDVFWQLENALGEFFEKLQSSISTRG